MLIADLPGGDGVDLALPSVLLSPLVVSSPHSGRTFPPSFLSQVRLGIAALRRSEDAFVDELFGCAPGLGAPLISACFPRVFVDVNREPLELDPRMFDGRLPPGANTRSLRVAGGLGTLARLAGDGQELYGERLPVSEALRRIEGFYLPYHSKLAALIASARAAFGVCILIDAHSMPSTMMGTSAREEPMRADVVIGDRFGSSCDPRLIEAIETSLRSAGYIVQRNKPYAGGYITEHYGNPYSRVHCVQIEINRALYMNEATFERHAGFAAVQANIERLCSDINKMSFGSFILPRRAAE
ncbi:MAG: N-formylglutamate amidohydrolase [Hyphomicrobiales bacterium]|nr:N-formylglutamate amidohydrolase [Hyphomicrobiales bacterium]